MRRHIHITKLAGIAALTAMLCSPLAASAEIALRHIEPLLGVACDAPYTDPGRFRSALADIRIITHDIDDFAGVPGRARTVMLLGDGTRLEANALFPGGRLRRITFEWQSDKPLSSLSVDHTCRITEAREILYDDAGRAQSIRVYAGDLETVLDDIALNPPPPAAVDPGGVSVGLIDSGVNYTLPPFADRLARTADGQLLGRDYWDGDDRPFDADTGRSAFFPLHHGSAVMSVLIAEAPMARVVPVRYPRPDMTKMADAVDWLAAQNVRIVSIAMGSNDIEEWRNFEAAARRHPRLLFIVSAGNNGRDIDRQPVYPAALRLSNTLVVTSSEPDGRLAQGSNWGAESVDIMTPGERIPVTDHRGAPGKASGSSFAVPRIAALAVRALAKNPDWHGPELRDWILKRARPLSGPKQTRYGWIPDPTDGP
ncbi:S8 family serine peptidase [Thalassospiraceae bacterium LMO-JJ14]|nr:S8 family serine peptidase [Thalassospiraceae bacterium LMO-JJ14]